MSNLVLNDRKFPVGTVVSVYPRAAAHDGTRPGSAPGSGAAAVESQTVASDGTATFTSLVDGTQYAFYASVGGEDRYVYFIKGSVFTPDAAKYPWKARVAARRAAIGTS